jgi:hypothetical protein
MFAIYPFTYYLWRYTSTFPSSLAVQLYASHLNILTNKTTTLGVYPIIQKSLFAIFVFIILSYNIILFINVNTIATRSGLVNKLHLFMCLCVKVITDFYAP